MTTQSNENDTEQHWTRYCAKKCTKGLHVQVHSSEPIRTSVGHKIHTSSNEESRNCSQRHYHLQKDMEKMREVWRKRNQLLLALLLDSRATYIGLYPIVNSSFQPIGYTSRLQSSRQWWPIRFGKEGRINDIVYQDSMSLENIDQQEHPYGPKYGYGCRVFLVAKDREASCFTPPLRKDTSIL